MRPSTRWSVAVLAVWIGAPGTPLTNGVITYSVIAEAPVALGAVQLSSTPSLRAWPLTPLGLPGTSASSVGSSGAKAMPR